MGSLKAEQKDHEKKSIWDSVREHIGKGIDRIDPLELAAVIGTTFLIKGGIDWAQVQAENYNPALSVALINPFAAAALWVALKESGLDKNKIPQNEIMEWLVSFVAAYIIVHNFGKIVEATGKLASDVLGLAKSLLGIGSAAVGAVA